MTVTNFGFLEKEFPMLYNIAASAEYYLYADPVASLFKLRQFGEKVTAYVCDTHQVDLPADDTFNNRIRALESENIYPANIASLVHNIKHRGNIAVHQSKGTVDDEKTILFSAFKLGKWFYETYSDENRDLGNLKFTPPKDLDARHALDQLEKEFASLEAKFNPAGGEWGHGCFRNTKYRLRFPRISVFFLPRSSKS